MGKKIFVTYKYWDINVYPMNYNPKTKVRDYVDEIDKLLDSGDNMYKGEDDNEDLSKLSEDTIARKLADRMYDSSVTFIMISKGMKDQTKLERDQWIPWEVSYSLKEISRGNRTSLTNGLLAIVLPDENGSYEYFLTENPSCNSTTYKRSILFKILSENMFNLKKPVTRTCNGTIIHEGYFSYIHTVKWNYFRSHINECLRIVEQIKENINDYDICKTIE